MELDPSDESYRVLVCDGAARLSARRAAPARRVAAACRVAAAPRPPAAPARRARPRRSRAVRPLPAAKPALGAPLPCSYYLRSAPPPPPSPCAPLTSRETCLATAGCGWCLLTSSCQLGNAGAPCRGGCPRPEWAATPPSAVANATGKLSWGPSHPPPLASAATHRRPRPPPRRAAAAATRRRRRRTRALAPACSLTLRRARACSTCRPSLASVRAAPSGWRRPRRTRKTRSFVSSSRRSPRPTTPPARCCCGRRWPRGCRAARSSRRSLPGEQYTDETTSRPFHYPPLVAAADPPAIRPEARGLALTEQLDNHPVRRRPPRPSRRSARPPRPHPSSSDALFTTARAAGTPTPLPRPSHHPARPISPTPQHLTRVRRPAGARAASPLRQRPRGAARPRPSARIHGRRRAPPAAPQRIKVHPLDDPPPAASAAAVAAAAAAAAPRARRTPRPPRDARTRGARARAPPPPRPPRQQLTQFVYTGSASCAAVSDDGCDTYLRFEASSGRYFRFQRRADADASALSRGRPGSHELRAQGVCPTLKGASSSTWVTGGCGRGTRRRRPPAVRDKRIGSSPPRRATAAAAAAPAAAWRRQLAALAEPSSSAGEALRPAGSWVLDDLRGELLAAVSSGDRRVVFAGGRRRRGPRPPAVARER